MAKCKVKETIKSHKRCPQGSATGKKNKAGGPVCAGGVKPEQIQMYERCPANEAPKSKSKKTSSKKAPSASAPRKPASKKRVSKGGFSTLGSQLKGRMRAVRREQTRPRRQDVVVDMPGFGPTSMGMDYSPEVRREMELYSNL